MKQFDCMLAAHETRMQLASIACERELFHDEQVLLISVMRFMNRYFLLSDAQLEEAIQAREEKLIADEKAARLSSLGKKELPAIEESGLLPPDGGSSESNSESDG